MAKPGTKPKPTALKALEGNPGKRPLNMKEPKPSAEIPKCPWWFDYWARKEWNRVCPELHRLGLLTSIDAAALEGYCSAYSRWLKAEREVLKGVTYEYMELKSLQLKRTVKPEVAVARDALNQVKAFCTEFGLTPSSRARMIIPSQDKSDPFEEFMDFCNESTKPKKGNGCEPPQ